MSFVLSVLICALLYAIKGGQHGGIRKKLHKIDFLLDGKVLSTLGFGLLVLFLSDDYILALFAAIGWLAACSPSLGEEVGAVGGYKGGWGEYVFKFDREYGIKKAVQRGVFSGACLSLAFWNPLMIIPGLLFVPSCYAGISIEQKRRGKKIVSWHYYEWIFGAVIGVFVYLTVAR